MNSGRKRYLLGVAVVAVLALTGVFLYPGWHASGPPPKTVGGDAVKSSGADFMSGELDGTGVVASAGGNDTLTLASGNPQGGYTSETISTGYPFNALGLHWLAQVPDGAGLTAKVRFSQDGSQWGDWKPVDIDELDAVPDKFAGTKSAGETIGGLLYVDKAQFFQYRFDLKQNASGQAPQVDRITASYIDAMGFHESPVSLTAFIRDASWLLEPPKANAETGIVSRAQWGADESLMNWDPDYAPPQKIIIHHTADGANWTGDPAAAVRSIYYYHAVSLGWGDIGYNYLIDWQGNIYEGRAGGASAPMGQWVIGGHAYGWNSGSIGISALGTYQDSDITGAMYNAFNWLMAQKSNQFYIDPWGTDYFVHYDPSNNYAPVGGYSANYLGHRDTYPTQCPGNMLYSHLSGFRNGAHAQYNPAPKIQNGTPSGDISTSRPNISADFYTPFGINVSSIVMQVDGIDVSAIATRTGSYVGYRPQQPLRAGSHTVYVAVSGNNNMQQTANWSFNVAQNSIAPRDYYWNWYDNVGGRNWVMMANPAVSGAGAGFDLAIAGRNMDLTSFLTGSLVLPGTAAAASYGGFRGGPVRVGSLSGAKVLVSQRTIWGQNSLEETPGVDEADLSDHYYWPWYDQQSPGMTDWVMVSNYNNSSVYYEITVAGQLKASGTILPGGNATPTFPGLQSGPVEVQAWTDAGKTAAAKVIASQRVLSGGGGAFNEVGGIPAGDLSDHYYWTWYDQQSPGALDWVMISNQNASSIFYEVKVGGSLMSSGTIAAGGNVTPSFPGTMTGPVEVQTWTDETKLMPAKSIASQRSIWGPSFEETPGYPAGNLNSSFAWTWYDNQSPGVSNWVMVTNMNLSPVYYEVTMAGALKDSGTIDGGGYATPIFPGTMNGPVDVHAWTDSGKQVSANIMASQRVLWNGYFNEVVGTTFPLITNAAPTGETSNNRPNISADLASPFADIDVSSVVMKLDGADVTSGANVTGSYVSYRPSSSLSAGNHDVYLEVTDTAGNRQTATWSFSVAQTNFTPRDYYWNWYDDVSGRNWVMMANPASAGTDANFELAIAGRNVDLANYTLSGQGCAGSQICSLGQVPSGRAMTGEFPGLRGGPVRASSLSGAKVLVSQRTIWGQNSLEETPGVDEADLSDHYYWPWYDQQSPGMTDWVMVSNYNNSSVYYEITVAGQLKASGTILPGGNATPTFPGLQSGPVEVQAWTDAGKTAAAKVIASQRVLSGGGGAFNEVGGIPAGDLSDHYYWTWYDQQSPGALDWVMISNQNASSIFYEVKVGGSLMSSGTIAAGGNVTPSFPGTMTGPVEVQTWTDETKLMPAKSIASQRSIWGPSFEETPGYPAGNLNSSFAWTWYDNQSPGVSNWVMVTNMNPVPIYYEITVAGALKGSGMVPANGYVTPIFPGTMSGPVEVHAWADSGKQIKANIMASQRVLMNGYFNEMTGRVFVDEKGTIPAGPSATTTADSSFEVREGNGNLLTTLTAGQTASVTYTSDGSYNVVTSTGYTHLGSSYIRMSTVSGDGIMQVTSYHDIPTWNPSLDDNLFRGTIEFRYSTVSSAVWVVNEMPLEMYLRGIGESGSGSPADLYKTMTVAARGYAYYHLMNGGKYGSSEIFHLKNSRNGNGDDQVYKGYGLEARFRDLVDAVNATAGQIVTYGGAPAITTYFSNSDGWTRSAQAVWGTTAWPWLQSVPDPDCNGMALAGHGVGLSGYGAKKRAERGDGYTTILGYYYTGTAVQPVDTSVSIRIAITRL